MPDHTHMKWLNKFVTARDPLPVTKKQLYNSIHSRDKADSLFGLILSMCCDVSLSWLSKFVASMDVLSHTKTQIHTSARFWDNLV